MELARRYVASFEPGLVGGDWYDAIALDDQRVMLSWARGGPRPRRPR